MENKEKSTDRKNIKYRPTNQSSLKCVYQTLILVSFVNCDKIIFINI